MGKFEVQGIVSSENDLPWVQFFISNDEGGEAKFQVSPQEARDMAQNIQEAAANAIYEAALVAWAKDRDPERGQAMAAHLIGSVREFRADKWGMPSMPEDWNTKETDE
jgi:hypothetical protein